ncbi:AMP-binding protein [Nonomuraea muscovyensis]|uniref:(2,3-dihydroxybenzoyl)adenylate synthase n=1 Tax=Nonomuraea muscovyensis TaxID=1124761 RepID=UPI0033FA6B8D
MLTGFVPWPEGLAARYHREGYWRGEVLGDLLRPWARTHPDRIAVIARGRRYGYAELDGWADRLAAGLADLGIGHHDRVVVQLPNSVEFVVTCVALFRLGALPVLALPAHRRAELTYLSEYAGAVALVVPDVVQGTDHRLLAQEVRERVPSVKHILVAPGSARTAEEPLPPHSDLIALADVSGEVRELPPPDPADPAFFLLSGGTTGLPKLIPRTHDDYAFQLRATAEAMGFDERGVYLAVLPVGHNAALGCPGVLGALRSGGKAVMAASPAPDEALPLAGREGATLTTLMPAFLPLWMETAELFDADLSGLTIEVGGARLDPEVARQVRPTLGATLTHWFGMAEGVLCFTRRDDPPEVPATSQGTPLCAADELKIVDDSDMELPAGQVGHLIARGPCTLRGYYDVPEHNATAFTADGFLRTGDLARFDEAGRLVVEGRAKSVINRGGEKVSAEEVESHLTAHPAVRAATVVPVPDATLGEKTCAFVVADGRAAPSLAELKEFLSERGLAEFKLPDRLETIDALPLTGVGKVDRRALAERVA